MKANSIITVAGLVDRSVTNSTASLTLQSQSSELASTGTWHLHNGSIEVEVTADTVGGEIYSFSFVQHHLKGCRAVIPDSVGLKDAASVLLDDNSATGPRQAFKV